MVIFESKIDKTLLALNALQNVFQALAFEKAKKMCVQIS